MTLSVRLAQLRLLLSHTFQAGRTDRARRAPGVAFTESTIKVHGDAAGSSRIVFDIYTEDLDQLKELFKFRGSALVLVIQEA